MICPHDSQPCTGDHSEACYRSCARSYRPREDASMFHPIDPEVPVTEPITEPEEPRDTLLHLGGQWINLSDLLRRLEALERRVAELEGRTAGLTRIGEPPSEPPSSTMPVNRLEAMIEQLRETARMGGMTVMGPVQQQRGPSPAAAWLDEAVLDARVEPGRVHLVHTHDQTSVGGAVADLLRQVTDLDAEVCTACFNDEVLVFNVNGRCDRCGGTDWDSRRNLTQ